MTTVRLPPPDDPFAPSTAERSVAVTLLPIVAAVLAGAESFIITGGVS